MAETDWHRDLMLALIEILKVWFARDPLVYVSGNLLIFYVPGDKRRHVSPDVFVVKGVARQRRPNYLVWLEGKGPNVVIELTSSSTRDEDLETKMVLYRDTLKVPEYFLFDPHGDYLTPRLQGYRRRGGRYVPVRPVAGRLPSKILGLHLEAHGADLRLYDPATEQWLPTPAEAIEQEKRARQAAERAGKQTERARKQAQRAREQAEDNLRKSEGARQSAEAEVERLRRQLEDLRRGSSGPV
jgi:Uma2 family endonuclease